MKTLVRSFWKKIETSQRPLQCLLEKNAVTSLRKDEEALELAVYPLHQLSAEPEVWSRLPASLWNSETLKRWGKLSSLPANEKSEKNLPKSKSLSLDWSAGHRLRALALNGEMTSSTFEIHTLLRETFSAALKEKMESHDAPTGTLLSIDQLEDSLQRQVLEGIIILAQTCTWKPFSFVKNESKTAVKIAVKTATKKPSPLTILVRTTLNPKEFDAITEHALAVGRANNLVRTLTDLPANVLNPGNYRDLARSLALAYGWKTEFLSTRHLEQLGAHAFLAVTRADPATESGILKLTYRPKKRSKHLALVGKGLCFDTGGYNIKTGSGMNGMHSDMSGSAVALATLAYFTETKASFGVTAYLALAENFISPTAYKPNEVVTACDGTTIEVVDTDAEGRMVLADTLALARRAEPDLCIDFATLTGAAIRALDTRIGAVFSNQPTLAQSAIECGKASGERVWTFPLEPDYRTQLKSDIADLLQCTHGNNSDHIYAATFLAHFAGEETPWLHLDLTPAKNKGGLGLISSTTTGFGVMWAVATAKLILSR